MAQSNVKRYLEERKKRLESAGTNAAAPSGNAGSSNSADRVSEYLQNREKRIAESGYEQKLRQRDIIVGKRAQEEREQKKNEQRFAPSAVGGYTGEGYGYDRYDALKTGDSLLQQVIERMNQYDRQEEEKPAIETPEDIALGNMTRGYKRGVIGAEGPKKDARLEYADARAKAAQRLAEAERKAEEERQTAAPAINLAELPKLSISPAGEVVGGGMPTASLPKLGEVDPMRLPGITPMPDKEEIHTVPTPEEYAAQLAEEAAEQELEAQKYNGWRALGANLMAGTADIGASVARTANAMAEPIQHFMTDELKWATEHTNLADLPEDTAQKVKDTAAIGDAAYDTFVDPAERLGAYADAENAKGGKLAEIWGSVVRSLPQNAMNAVLALMSGGTSITGQAMQALKTAGGGTGRAVLEAAKQMANNPALWNSFVQMYGSRYEAAEADGADPVAATLTATITTLMNAAVEAGGGVESLPFEAGGVYGWVKSALEEGREEVIQQVIDQLGQKAYVDESIPWYSAEDERAVVNPAVLGENALVGTLAGGLAGVPGAVAGRAQESGRTQPKGTYPRIEPTDIDAARAQEPTAEAEAMKRLADEAVAGTRPVPVEASQREEAETAHGTQTDAELVQQRTEAETRRAQFETAARAIEDEGQRQAVEQAAEKYGEDAAVFAGGYKGGDVEQYRRGFDALYTAGKVRLPVERLAQTAGHVISAIEADDRQRIWLAGRNSAARTVTPGAVRMTAAKQTKIQRSQYRMLDAIGKRYGYEFDIVDSIGGAANGAYVNGGRRIVVAADAAEGAIVQAGVHELVHALKSGDADAYGVLEAVVVKHLTAADSMFDLEYAVGERMRQYAASGQRLTREDAVEEIVCEAVPTIFTDGESVKEFVRTNRTLAEKIRDFFAQFAEEIREIAERYMEHENRDEIANLLGKRDALKEIARTLDEALEAAGENNRPQESGETEFARKRSKDADDVEKWTPDGQFMWEHMSAAERGVFRETLNNTPKEKLQKSADGQYIVEAGRALVYTDGNRNNPKVSRIVYFYLDDGTDLDGAMNTWRLYEEAGKDYEQARRANDDAYDEGCTVVYYNGDYIQPSGNGIRRERESGRTPDQGSGREVSQDAGRKALAEALEFSDGETRYTEQAGISVSGDGEVGYAAEPETLYSLRTLPKTDYITERDKAARALARRLEVEVEDAQKYIDNLTSVAAIITADQARLDFEPEGAYDAVKHNSEYKWTVDFSTLCKKRLLYTGTFDAIQSELADAVLTEDDYIQLRDMMARRGYEVACAFCYVESRRKNNGEIIQKFLEIYREAEKSGGDMELGPSNRRKKFAVEKGFSPVVADFNTSEGFADILHNHRGVYDAYMYFMNARGTSKPKLIETRTDYENMILSKFRYASSVKAMNRRGGLRLQSFSDFEVINLLDMMQVVTDMARVGLMSQAYTKVPEFARVFGGTGIKINLSLVTKGLDEHGDLIFDDVEGMPHEEAFRIREMYGENVGTILVGRDDDTIRAAMKDPRIDFIIPYHRSGWSAENQQLLGIAGYEDYTGSQNEVGITGKVTNFFPSEYWDYSRSGDENAEEYLRRCAETGRTPKFPQFAGESGYWKMLIDFKMYDNEGRGVPQRAVRPDVNMDEARRVLNEYRGGHVKLPVARDVVEDFLSEYRERHPESRTRFSLNGTAEIESVLNERHEIMAPVDIAVDSKSIDAMAKKALREGVEAQTEPKIRQIAGRILRETGSRYSKEQMVENLTAVMKRYADGGADGETLRAVAEMSKAIIEKSTRADNSLREQYADVRRRLRETGVRLTEVQKQEAANISGSYDEYRRSMMGTVKITEQAGDLTSQWDELSGLHPELFAPDTSEGDMVDALKDFQLMMKPRYENRYGMDMDTAAVEMALRIEGDLLGLIGAKDAAKKLYKNAEQVREKAEKKLKEAMQIQQQRRVDRFRKIAEELKTAKASGDHAEQAKIMNRYRAAMKATGLEEAYAEVRATYREREAEKAENRTRIELREKVVKRAGDLMKMMTGQEKGKRVPTALQNLVLEVLETLDINGERAAAEGRQTQKAEAYRQRLAQIRTAYEEIWNSQSRGEAPDGLDGLMMTISERNLEEIREALDVLGRSDAYRLREMTGDQLKALDGLLKTVKHTVESVGRLWRMERYENVQALGDASIAEMEARGEQKLNAETAAGQARDFLALDMLEPVSYGERLGKAGQAVIQALMDGEKTKFARIREAAEATRRMLEAGKLTGYDIGKWRRNVRTVKLGSGRTVKMTDTMLMSLYLTAKRPQGLQHLLGNGMRIPTTKETGAQAEHILLTQADIAGMGGLLTDRQRALADRMGRYLSTDAAKWGNDVTQRLYLYDAFTEKNYWPISSDPNMLKTQEPEGDRAFNAIVNAGFTKPLNQKANNPVIIMDAFDVFNRHIGEMASYAGYAEVMTDTMAWINYRQRTEDGLIAGTVKESIEKLLGNGGVKYLTKLVQDINGARRGGDGTQLGKLMSNYKRAAVMGKIRVAIQQPTSIVRAAAEISPAYLLSGMKAGKGAQAEMQRYSSLAWWKANGNYEIGVGRGTDAILWGETSRADAAIDTAAKIGGLGLDPGKVDDWAWTRMWSAVRREISRTRPELAQGSDEYFEAVAERFEAIMDRTQVVDTVMHRSDMMRSKDGLVKSLTSFMSEPTKSYNMMARAVMEAGRNPKSKKAWKKLAASTAAFAASGAATAAMTALFDAIKYRDDEDDLLTYITEGGFREDWTERWLKSLIQNVNPLENIPIISDAYSALAAGEDVTVTGFQGLKDVKTAYDKAKNYFFGDNSKKLTWYGAVSPTVKAVSELTGLPLSGMLANAEALAHLYDPTLLQAKSSMATTNDAYTALYKAMAKGDDRKALEIRTQLAKGLHGNTPKNPKEIDTGIAHALAEQDPRVMQAYEMRLDGSKTSELVKLKKQIMADGFTDQQVTAAINYCANLLDTEEREKDMDAQLEAKLYTNKDLFNAIRSGDTQDVGAVAEYLESVSDAKDPAAAIKSSVSSEFKAEYLELTGSGRQAEAEKLAKKLAIVGIDAETTAEWVKSDRYDAMRQAVADGNAAEAGEIIAALQADGATVSGIVSALNYRFKDEYVELVKSGRQTEADRLAGVLQGLGLYYKDGKTNYFRDEKLEEWVEDAE